MSLPGTTEAFEAANIFARISGYIAKRYVDIGDHVKAGDFSPRSPRPSSITRSRRRRRHSPRTQATLNQAQAKREIANVTWDRDSKLVNKGWVTKQQGDTDG